VRKAYIIFLLVALPLAACTLVKNPATLSTPQPYIYPVTTPTIPDAQYRIQPGDTLDIKFFYNPQLNETALPVRPDGRIALQLVPEVMVAGLTPAEARKLLVEKYESTELRYVEVAVAVKTFSNQKIFVDGEVGKSGLYPLTGHLTVLQAIAEAGGMRETARVNEVILIRRGADNKPIVTTLNLEAAREGRDVNQDPLLVPYDIVFVPRSPIANLDLWVDQYIRRLLPFSLPSPIPQPTTSATW
jgi:polysaccharide biosynthesis/export protein